MGRNKTECEKKMYEGNQFNRGMTFFSQLLNSLLCIGFSFILGILIDSVQYYDPSFIIKGSYIFSIYLFLFLLFSFLNRRYKNRYINQSMIQLKNHIFKRLIYAPRIDSTEDKAARYISAFSSDLAIIEGQFICGDIILVSILFQFIGAAGAIIWYCWYMAIPILLVTCICLHMSLRHGRKLTIHENNTSEQNSRFVSQVKDLLNGYLVIKGFKAEEEVFHIFSTQNMKLEETKCGKRMTFDVVNIYGDISSLVVNTVIIGLGFILAYKSIITVGSVMAMIQLANYILQPIRVMPGLISNRNAAIAILEKLNRDISCEQLEEKKVYKRDFNRDIKFEHVSFSYIENEQILEDISLKFEKGKSYAIVGGSGSGKSTILKLLLGYYTNYGGSITIDDVEMKQIELGDLYNMISMISQNVFMFNSSITNNITMFKQFEDEKINKSINLSGLREIVDKKGNCYLCGESGNNLSGGERQRVSIARCLLRGSKIILVDEATASLDNENAILIETQLLNLEDVTKIVVTHRYNQKTMSKYDEIIVLDKGRVIERGTFSTLMSQKGYFYSLYTIMDHDEITRDV